jgi:hypothetical protein
LVASKVGARNALVRGWKRTVLHLEDIGNIAGEEAALAGALLEKLKVFQVCNCNSLPDGLSGNLHHGSLPLWFRKRI